LIFSIDANAPGSLQANFSKTF